MKNKSPLYSDFASFGYYLAESERMSGLFVVGGFAAIRAWWVVLAIFFRHVGRTFFFIWTFWSLSWGDGSVHWCVGCRLNHFAA